MMMLRGGGYTMMMQHWVDVYSSHHQALEKAYLWLVCKERGYNKQKIEMMILCDD